MERKQFLAAFGLAGAALTAGAIASAASDTTTTGNTACGPHPMPSGASPRPHVPHARPSSIDSAYRRVERIIEQLSKDPNDYGGYKSKALAELGQAYTDLQQAVAFEQAHPSSTSMPL
jgi:hypothetical protein